MDEPKEYDALDNCLIALSNYYAMSIEYCVLQKKSEPGLEVSATVGFASLNVHPVQCC
jgi:hypothetical protein